MLVQGKGVNENGDVRGGYEEGRKEGRMHARFPFISGPRPAIATNKGFNEAENAKFPSDPVDLNA